MVSVEEQLDLEDTTCGSLLRELQHIWNEIGESDEDRDRMLLELEQECLLVYRRKVENASLNRARLNRALADSKAEIATLSSILGDRPIYLHLDTRGASLKEQLNAVVPELEALRSKKEERVQQVMEIKTKIQEISEELFGSVQCEDATVSVAEQDLYSKQIEDYRLQLQALLEEKSDRVHRILENVKEVHDLCFVLGVDFYRTASNVHPSLVESASGPKSISNDTLEQLKHALKSLQEEKKQRIEKLRDIGSMLRDLWTLMDTPEEEQQLFQNVTCMLGIADSQVSAPRSLASEVLEQATAELERLDHLKTSKLKELVLKKRLELEEICRNAHMEADRTTSRDKTDALIDSGMADPSTLFANLEEQIAKAKDEALSRKEVLDKIEKWLAACEEETWLEDYNKDENRYNAGRGAHVNLKRAEKARVTVQKLPALVEALTARVKAWEEEKCTLFLYDGVHLLSMLDEYNLLRQEKEEEKRRLRDQKRLQEQLINEKETLFGSRPSPYKVKIGKKSQAGLRVNGSQGGTPGNRRLSVVGAHHPGTPDTLMPRVNGVTPARLATSVGKELKKDKSRPAAPVNFVAMPKEDFGSIFSGCRHDENSLQFV
ncbi:hypothetical protein O6H91_04G049300 [Diphasiastrum complanatum]|uniref:Uncharacterized protein n=2 Tax=Diphasiastrum complanatum TaxID=34168 RepID=A0ACC2DX15_DIPCM|nr:hypothetical protein O6H91_04G049300 [Diphasiastrum complanatum]KAJ7558636.1 hypothetical protein O6H91_04G049300 [Diphasiastrum complanatum]